MILNWKHCISVSIGIINDRTLRRKIFNSIIAIDLGALLIGYLILDEWLNQSLLAFTLWWLAVALITLLIVCFGVFEAFKVIQEEKKALEQEVYSDHNHKS